MAMEGDNLKFNKGINRREFLKKAAIGGGAVMAGGLLGREILRDRESKEGGEESYKGGELFQGEVKGFQILYGQLRRDQTLFVDENGSPIEEPVELITFQGISPGVFDENKLLVGSINQEWLDVHRERICKEYSGVECDPRRQLPRVRSVINSIREAVKDKGLNPETFLDVVKHFGNMKVIGAEDYSRIKYVRNFFGRNSGLPDQIIAELSKYGPGLAGQESSFDNSSVSSMGAKGIFQFMPNTFRELGFSTSDYSSLIKQVDAVGKHFYNNYRYILRNSEESLKSIRSEFFDDDDTFAREFIVPVLINSYNVGQGRMVAVIDWFASRYPSKDVMAQKKDGFIPGGYDVFKIMSVEAREATGGLLTDYGKHSSEYVPRIYALASLLEN